MVPRDGAGPREKSIDAEIGAARDMGDVVSLRARIEKEHPRMGHTLSMIVARPVPVLSIFRQRPILETSD